MELYSYLGVKFPLLLYNIQLSEISPLFHTTTLYNPYLKDSEDTKAIEVSWKEDNKYVVIILDTINGISRVGKNPQILRKKTWVILNKWIYFQDF